MGPDPRQAARELVVFCDGLEQAGLVDYARRGRVVARMLLRALDAIADEQSVRRALQQRCERQQEIIGHRLDQELQRELEREQRRTSARAAPPATLDLTAPADIRDLTAR